jgi:hypothetical protein
MVANANDFGHADAAFPGRSAAHTQASVSRQNLKVIDNQFHSGLRRNETSRLGHYSGSLDEWCSMMSHLPSGCFWYTKV